MLALIGFFFMYNGALLVVHPLTDEEEKIIMKTIKESE